MTEGYSHSELPEIYFRKGDRERFTAIYNAYYTRIWYFVRRYIPDPEPASDITSETFIKFWQSPGDFAAVQQVEAFLHITARNASLNHLQQINRKDAVYEELQKSEPHTAFPYDLNTELMELIFQEVRKLPAKYHRVFELAFIEGYKNEEIAGILNLSHQTVRTYKKELLHELKGVFSEKGLLCALFYLACQ